MKKGDIWLIAILLVGISWFMVQFFQSQTEAQQANGPTYAQITVDGKPYQTVELTEETQDIEIRTKFGYNLVRVSNNGVQIIDADCPDDLCIKMGFKDRVGETIVCLPNRVMIEVIGDHSGGGETDAVAI
jgi:hypothetical protein